MKKNETTSQRFSIKKLKFGAASVLVGVAFLANGQLAVANEQGNTNPAVENTSGTGAPASTTDTTSTPAAGATATPVQIQPTNVTVGVTGQARLGATFEDGAEIVDGATLNFNVKMALPDREIKAGDFINFELPNTLRTTPSPQTITITDASGVHVGDLVLTLNRDASGTYINTTGVLTFTDGYAGKIDNVMELNFNVSNSNNWPTGGMEEMAVLINGTKYGTGTNLKLFRSQNTVFGTSTRLFQVEEMGSPYTLYHQSEVAIVNPDEETYTTVVYTLDPDTLDYARYDVATIRSKGYEFLLGAARNSYQRVNTLNNDLGITAEVNDEGTKVTLKIPNMPAGFGLNGGSIPVLLSDKAIAEKYVQYYNSTMEVYINPVGSTFDEATDTPDRTVHGKNSYQFSGSSANSTTINQVIVQHVDKNGNQLAARTITEYKIGEAYTTSPVEIEGYQLVETPANKEGNVTAGTPIFVRYVYDLKTTESTEEKTVTRTIEYVHEDGSKAAEPVTETLTFTRTVTTVDATGEKTYGEWTAPQTFKEVTSPSLENYTADKATVAEVTVSADATDITEKVTYSPVIEHKTETKETKLTVNYHGAGDKTPESKVETVTWTRFLEVNKATGEIISQTPWEAAQLVYNEVKSPVLENYTVDKETVVDQPVHETDVTVDVYYTPTSSETSETKTITRTIKYVDENGKEVAPAVTQTVTFTRTVKTNDATGEKTYGEWTTDNADFSLVVSPEIAEHTTDTKEVGLVTATPDQDNLEVTVVYKKNKKVVTQPTQPTQPTKPTQPNKPTPKPDKDDKEGDKVETTVSTQATSTPSKPAGSKKVLPSTGDAGSALTVLGMSLIGLTGLIKKGKKDQED